MLPMHYHAWLRRGRTFIMNGKQHRTRQAAHKAAVRLRPAPADRLVLVCDGDCFAAVRSRRPAVRWSVVARAAGLPAAAAGRLKSAYDAERRRARGEAPDSPAAPAPDAASPNAAPAGDAGPAEARRILRTIKRVAG